MAALSALIPSSRNRFIGSLAVAFAFSRSATASRAVSLPIASRQAIAAAATDRSDCLVTASVTSACIVLARGPRMARALSACTLRLASGSSR